MTMRGMLKACVSARAFLLGLLFAAAGFSFALATPQQANGRVAPEAAQVGVNNGDLFMTNVLIDATPGAELYDLGFVGLNEEITRYLTARGGCEPYNFSGVFTYDINDSFSNFGTNRNGCMSGLIISTFNPPGTVLTGTFSVTDMAGNIFTAMFQATTTDLVDFHALVLNDGDVGLSYHSFIDLTNGVDNPSSGFGTPALPNLADKPNGALVTVLLNDGTHPFSTAGSATPVRVDGTGFATLADVGLAMTYNGTVYGVPLYSGAYEIDVLAFDHDRTVLDPFANNVAEDTFTFNVAPNAQLEDTFGGTPDTSGQKTSSMIIQSLNMKATRSFNSGKDSFQVTANLNPNIEPLDSTLNAFVKNRVNGQPITIRFNSFEYTTVLTPGNVSKTTFANGVQIQAYLHGETGALKVKLKKASFNFYGDLAGANNFLEPGPDKSRLVVSICAGNNVKSAEVLECRFRESGTMTSLDYKYGNPGGNIPFHQTLGGHFMVYIVNGNNGKDKLSGFNLGSTWRANFFIAPRLIDDNVASVTPVILPDGSLDTPGLNNLTAARVRIGTYADVLDPAFSSPFLKVKTSATKTTFQANGLNNGLRNLTIDDRKYQGRLLTYVILGTGGSPTDLKTGIQRSFRLPGTPGVPMEQFPLGIDLERTTSLGQPFDNFHGEGARRIMADKNGRKWGNRPGN